MNSGKENSDSSGKTDSVRFPRHISQDTVMFTPDEVLKQLSDFVEEAETEQQKAQTDRQPTPKDKTNSPEKIPEADDTTRFLDSKVMTAVARAERPNDDASTKEIGAFHISAPTRVITRKTTARGARSHVDAEAQAASDNEEKDAGISSLQRRSPKKQRKYELIPRILLIALACFLAAYFIVPMRRTIMARSSITARRPAAIRAERDGVVERLLVHPNQVVNKGDPLIRLDDSRQRARLGALRKMDDLLNAEYREALALPDGEERRSLVRSRIELHETEKALLADQIDRSVIVSPIYGTVFCEDPEAWHGRPVRLGQRILDVADPNKVELEIQVPETLFFSVVPGDDITFYPNIVSYPAMKAKITKVPHRASAVHGGKMAFICHAEFTSESERENIGKALLGLRGGAKVYGPRRSLAVDIIERPTATFMRWLTQ